MRIMPLVLATPFLLYGAVRGYLWYEVKASADDMAQAASQYATISYDSVYTSLLGDEVGLDNIIIKPLMTQDVFRIEQIRVSAPHAGYFISAGNNLEKGELPENLAMQIKRLHIDINSELFTLLEQMQQQAALAQPDETGMWLASLDTLGCGDLTTFTINDYRTMGLGNIIADANISMAYNDKQGNTRIKVDTHVDKLYDIGFSLDFDLTPQSMSSALSSNNIPRTTLSYRDTGYYHLRNNYCAELNESNIEEYVDRHITQLSSTLKATFPEQTINAYKQFMIKGGTFNIELDPSEEQSLEGLSYYASADIIDMLGLSFSINNTRLETEQIQWGGKQTGVTVSRASKQEKKPVIRRDALRPTVSATPSKNWQQRTAPASQVKDIDDAGKYLKKMVEVTTIEGKVRKGVLGGVTEDNITIVVEYRTGSLSYPVELKHITEFRVHK